jgi:hypothetical protein
MDDAGPSELLQSIFGVVAAAAPAGELVGVPMVLR